MANTQRLGHPDLSQHQAGHIDLLDNASWSEDVFRHHQQPRKPAAAFKAGRLLTPSRVLPRLLTHLCLFSFDTAACSRTHMHMPTQSPKHVACLRLTGPCGGGHAPPEDTHLHVFFLLHAQLARLCSSISLHPPYKLPGN